MAKLLLAECEVNVLQQELTEWLATNDERRSWSRWDTLKRVLEKVERVSKTADRS